MLITLDFFPRGKSSKPSLFLFDPVDVSGASGREVTGGEEVVKVETGRWVPEAEEAPDPSSAMRGAASVAVILMRVGHLACALPLLGAGFEARVRGAVGCAPTRDLIKISWLRDHFNNLPPNASSEITGQFARAYALSLMGCMMFPDRTGVIVHLQYLLMLENWWIAGGYAWGAAILAYLYREMGRSVLHMTQSSSTGGDLGGWVTLL
ncbi:unnamed protein product [Linum tenue]|uniref:Aminotransferase-like plant mobile domain-containing protein n=1 Tax=Linum tenue TaxID=586396 RepID=A0AAV0R5U0_9ROSI|nr:unnamed protein product [Linum tenue]